MVTERDWKELYGRLDERLKAIEALLSQFNGQRKCETNSEKIKTLEKIVWTSLGTAIAAAFKAFWPGGHI